MRIPSLMSLVFALLLLSFTAPVAVLAQDENGAERAEEKTPEPVLKLLEAGAEPRIELRFKPEKGATAETEMRMRMTMTQSMNGMEMPPTKMPVMRMIMATKVDDVKANGDVSYHTTITKADVEDEPGVNPMMRMQMNEMLRSMEGMIIRATVSDRGIARSSDVELPAGTDPMLRQQMEGMMGSFDQFASPVPEEAVGVGARWSVATELAQQGMTMKQTAVFTLKGVNGNEIDLDVDLTQSADPQNLDNPMLPPGATMRLDSLAGKGSGTTKLLLGSILPNRARMNSTTDFEMTMSMNGQAQRMKQSMDMDMRMTVVEPTEDGEEQDD